MTAPTMIMFGGWKGGTGKTTLTAHLAWRAVETGQRVLVIDADRQGDCYRRIVGDTGNLLDMPPATWGANGSSMVVHSPDAYTLPTPCPFDLVVIDTGTGLELPRGPNPHFLLVPVDGVDGARNATETIARAQERGIAAILILLNGIEEGGKLHAKAFADLGKNAPAGVAVLDRLVIPRGGCIKRSARSCRPAWQDFWVGNDARTLRGYCDVLLTHLRPLAVA
jgi:hypothetical protein